LLKDDRTSPAIAQLSDTEIGIHIFADRSEICSKARAE